jgi:hypothetical protein
VSVPEEQTRLQMLQSGRGNGYRAALAAGKPAVDEVVDCVVTDPRWDRQVENRDDYYAKLLLVLGGDVEPIVASILSSPAEAEASACWLPIGVLAQMARRGHAAAAASLALLIRRGRKWRECFDALEAAGGQALIASLIAPHDVEHLLMEVGSEEVAEAARLLDAPWDSWAKSLPALRFIALARNRRTREPKPFSGPLGWIAHRLRAPDRTDSTERMTVADLLEAATKPGPTRPIVDALLRLDDPAAGRAIRAAAAQGSPRERAVALHVLAKQGCVDYVGDAKAFLLAQTKQSSKTEQQVLRTGYVRYLEAMPPRLTLPLAREWLSAPWPLSYAAEQLLSRHATPDDRTLLEEAGAAALPARDMYRLCSMIEGLGVIGAPESLPFLRVAYEQAPYSFARRRALECLRVFSEQNAVRDLVLESLWDCEPESRALACQAPSLAGLATSRRIKEIRDDAFEEPEVRRAAAGRSTFSGSAEN